jgi:hypothetical protein
MRQVVGGRAVDAQAAPAPQMGGSRPGHWPWPGTGTRWPIRAVGGPTGSMTVTG